MLQKALNIASDAHRGQLDKGGKPYIFHPLYVASHVDGINEKIVALLHDVVEDTDVTLDDLRNEGFSEEIICAINVLTKTDDDYDNYLKKVKSNEMARKVKIEDIKHNMDGTRLKSITEKDKSRIEKYKKALGYLLG